jgi:restriction system protein
VLHLLWIIPLALLIAFVASPRFRGDIAESRVRRILASGLDPRRYTLLNDVVIPFGGGTIRIDHVVVSKFGIFVIESQYARGLVSGTEVQDRWKQYRLGRFRRFDNPLHRNRLQAEALATLLDFPSGVFQRFVVMVGQKGFKDRMPENVLEPEKLIRNLRRRATQLLDADQAVRALKGLESARLKPRGGFFVSPRLILLGVLILVLLSGLYLAFGDELKRVAQRVETTLDRSDRPDAYHPDGRPKTEREMWEDSLRCAYSPDTGRCSCYEPDGSRVELDADTCRALAERGSILQR